MGDRKSPKGLRCEINSIQASNTALFGGGGGKGTMIWRIGAIIDEKQNKD